MTIILLKKSQQDLEQRVRRPLSILLKYREILGKMVRLFRVWNNECLVIIIWMDKMFQRDSLVGKVPPLLRLFRTI